MFSPAEQGVITRFFNALLNRKEETGFKALGNGLWIAAYTNNFKDKHGEILSQSSHDRYIARVKAGLVPMPELWHWHLEGTRHGQAKWLDRVGDHMIVAIGTFDDTPAAKAAEANYKKQSYKLSHGFSYPSWAKKDGVYLDYNTFEITTLPPGREANPFTTFEEVQQMAVNEQIKESLSNLFGDSAPDIIKQLESIDNRAQKVAEFGVQFKDFGDLTDPKQQKQASAAESGEFASIVLEQQAKTLDMVERTLKVLEGFGKRVEAVEAAKKAYDDAAAELKAEKNKAPRRVDDAKKEAEGEEADEAKKKLDEEEEEGKKEYDSMFPGLKIPAKKS